MPRISYSQLAIEFLSVVFAVLLALGLNAFKQSLDAEAKAETIKNATLKECIKNQNVGTYVTQMDKVSP